MDDMLDSLIISLASDRWQKVARIIAVISEHGGNRANLDAIAARIRALVNGGTLEAKGNLSQWRHSEVRRAQSGLVNSKRGG